MLNVSWPGKGQGASPRGKHEAQGCQVAPTFTLSCAYLSRSITGTVSPVQYHHRPDCGTDTGHVSGPASLKLSEVLSTQPTGNENEQVMRHRARVTGDKLKPWCDNSIVSGAAAI